MHLIHKLTLGVVLVAAAAVSAPHFYDAQDKNNAHNQGQIVSENPYVSISGGNVYFHGNMITGADALTFSVYKDSHFGRDKSHVFYLDNIRSEVVVGADLGTFSPFPSETIGGDIYFSYYGKDNKNIYCYSQVLNADYATFVPLSFASAKDKANTYDSCSVYDPARP